MTSGTFHAVEIDSIVVNRSDRQRRELTGIPELAKSISDSGLINPILVQRETLELIAGERRLAACRSLGWTHINAQFEDEVDSTQLRLLELEENVRRVDLEWADHCAAILNYHEARKSVEPTWRIEDSADALNYATSNIFKMIAVAKEIRAGNERVIAAPKLSTAVGIVTRANERKAQNETLLLDPQPIDAPEPESILVADFNEWATTYEGPKFNFLHCDFPYGIDANKFKMGPGGNAHAIQGNYDDSPEVYWRLIETLNICSRKLLNDSCHFVFWFSMKYYTETLDKLQRIFSYVDPFPLVWIKSDGAGVLPDPSRTPRRIYETAFFGSNGDRKIVGAKANAIGSSSIQDIHMSIKAPDMLRHFFSMFVDSNTRMLDPTCGSGGALRVAESLGAQYVLGLERNEEFAKDARAKLKREREARK